MPVSVNTLSQAVMPLIAKKAFTHLLVQEWNLSIVPFL